MPSTNEQVSSSLEYFSFIYYILVDIDGLVFLILQVIIIELFYFTLLSNFIVSTSHIMLYVLVFNYIIN